MKIEELFIMINKLSKVTGKRYALHFEHENTLFETLESFKRFISITYYTSIELLNADYNGGHVIVKWCGEAFIYDFKIIELSYQ